MLEQIATAEPRPPRQIDDTIPRELERICLKALAKRAADRYSTARDLADDLRHFLQAEARRPGSPGDRARAGRSDARLDPGGHPAADRPMRSGLRAGWPSRSCPRGCGRSTAHDADFFLELLPGPRDRDGLPEGLRFWKARIESTDPDFAFKVGLIYGPSGCGKSSLVKAGLLPRLGKDVRTVYVEATPQDTEARLLRGIRKACLELAAGLGARRRPGRAAAGARAAAGQKVLLVLDQFEQWLFARRGEEEAELVAALRQCDGEHVQAIIMVRDDFWMAATRFMSDLEIDLLADRNVAAVDLFDLRHARKVLAAFGRAYGALPEKPSELSKDQEAFLDQAIAGLAQDGKVIPVRLALFAEMVKGKPWMPATLREVGGTEGVGITFLEEAFASAQANPKHRLHRKAAQAVLTALLPRSGADIKGRMRSEAELREASGYAGRPREFDELIRILDHELRLITPTDPEGRIERASVHPPACERLLSAHARLPGAVAARVVDAEAAGDPPGPGGAAIGRSGGALGGEAGEPAPSFAAGMDERPGTDPPEELDRRAASDDATGRSVPWPAGLRRVDRGRARDLGRSGGIRILPLHGAGRITGHRRHLGRGVYRASARGLPALGRSAARPQVERVHRVQPHAFELPARVTARQPQPGRTSLLPADRRRSRRSRILSGCARSSQGQPGPEALVCDGRLETGAVNLSGVCGCPGPI